MQLRARIFPSLTDLAPYADRWNELVQLSPGNSIFLTWEWLTSWKKYVARKTPLFVIAVFDNKKRLQAALPLYRSSFLAFRCVRYSYLRPMGDCHCGAEYPDIIFNPETEEQSIKCISDAIARNKASWDCIYIHYISGWTGAIHRFTTLCSGSTSFLRKREAVFSSITLPVSTDELPSRLGKSFFKLVQRQQKKIARLGPVTITLCQDERNLPRYLENLFALHQKRWKSTGRDGSFVRRPLMKDFYTGFSGIALQKKWLKIFELRVNNRTMATQIGYIYNNKFLQIQEGFDPDGPGGLGNCLRYAVLEWCISNNINKYDYLGGAETHKLKWGAEQRTGYHLFCGRSTIKNLLLALLDIWPTGRFITVGPPASLGRPSD